MIKPIIHHELDAVIKETTAIAGAIKQTKQERNIAQITQRMVNYFRSHEYCTTDMMTSIKDIKVHYLVMLVTCLVAHFIRFQDEYHAAIRCIDQAKFDRDIRMFSRRDTKYDQRSHRQPWSDS